jgi:hypothetical protein
MTTRFAGAADMGHQIDLSGNGIAAPDDDQIRIGDLARIDAATRAHASKPSGIGKRNADRGEHARIAHGMAQPLDPVALHQAHGAGIEIGPDGLRTVPGCGFLQRRSRLVQRLVPSDALERPDPLALRADAAHGKGQPVGVVLALGVAGDLRADDPGGIAVVSGAAHLADAPGRQALDIERAGARAIVRADRMNDIQRHDEFLKSRAKSSPPRCPTATRPQAAQARLAGMMLATAGLSG